jgi:competence protein ComEC
VRTYQKHRIHRALFPLVLLICLGIGLGIGLLEAEPPSRGLKVFRGQAEVCLAVPLERDRIGVTHLDVGQGNAALIQSADAVIVIDTGRHDRNDTADLLAEHGVTRIDLLVGTHPHADHIGQFQQILSRFPVTEVWMSGSVHTTATYERALDAVLSSEAGYREPRAGERYRLGDLVIEVLHPDRVGRSLNNDSLVLLIHHPAARFLFPGDIEQDGVTAVLERAHASISIHSDVFLLPHHGSAESCPEELLQAVDPVVGVYSAERGNPYGHPDRDTLELLNRHGVPVFGTDTDGSIHIVAEPGRLLLCTAR